MRKLINLIALLIMASSVTWAQDKKSFTLEDLMPGGNNYYNLLPQNLYGLQWWGDVCINADIEEVKTIQPANGKENVLITLQEVNELLANKELGKINHFRNASFPYAEKMMLVNTTSNKVLIDLTKKEIIWSQPHQKIDNFNKGRREDAGYYAISVSTPYRSYYALWRIFPDNIYSPLFIQSLAVTFNDAAERAFQYLQNCNVLLKVKDNTFFEPYYGISEDIVAFGKYRGKRLAEV